MKTLKEDSINEIIIEKSRFICYLKKVYNEKDAQDYINNIKSIHNDANHNCSAFIIGYNKEIKRKSDDGEPSGTAGTPMLEVLEKNNLTNIVAIVTRYFGGIKLGAGGLIRAYSKSVSKSLDNISLLEYKNINTSEIIFDYKYTEKINNLLSNYYILNKSYQNNIIFLIGYEKIDKDKVVSSLTNITNGNITIKNKNNLYLEVEMKDEVN